MASLTSTDYLRFQIFFKKHGVDSQETYSLVQGISRNYPSWHTHGQDRYIKKYTDDDMPYSVEYVHATNQVLIHLGRQGLLGTGRSSTVSKTLDFFSGQVFAHKKPKKAAVLLITPDQEYALLEQFKGCSNVVQVVQRTHHGLLFEYMNQGDLSKYKFRNRNEQLSVMQQVSLAVSQIHSKNFVHRDVRSSNFLCNKTAEGRVIVKICDLEFLVPEYANGVHIQGFWRCCSPRLLQIQIVRLFEKTKTYFPSKADDLHALAVTLYELETRQSPSFCATIYTIMQALETKAVHHENELVEYIQRLRQEMNTLYQSKPISKIAQLAIDMLKGTITSAQALYETFPQGV